MRNKVKYIMDDIEIGDEILFDDKYEKIGHSIFWKVIHKNNAERLLIEIKEMGFAEKRIVDILDVIAVEKSVFNFEEVHIGVFESGYLFS